VQHLVFQRNRPFPAVAEREPKRLNRPDSFVQVLQMYS